MDTFGKFIEYVVRLFVATIALFAIIMAVFRVAGFFAITTVITFVVASLGAEYHDYLLFGCIFVWMIGGFIAILAKRFFRFMGLVLFASAVQTTFVLLLADNSFMISMIVGLAAGICFTGVIWWIADSRDHALAEENRWFMVSRRDKDAHL